MKKLRIRPGALILLAMALAGCGDPKRPEPQAGGQPLSYWVKRTKYWKAPISPFDMFDNGSGERRNAFLMLARIGPEAVPALVKLLKDRDADTRKQAAEALGIMEPKAVAAVPALIEALKDSDRSTRFAAAFALGKIGSEAKSAIPALVRLMEENDSIVNPAPMFALGQMGQVALPHLLGLATNRHANVRANALSAMTAQYPMPEAVKPLLLAALKDQDTQVRLVAASTISRREVDADAALPLLLEAIQRERDESVRKAIKATLGVRDATGVTRVPILVEELQHADHHKRSQAAFDLSHIGPAAKDALPALQAALRDEQPGVRVQAARAVWRISGDAAAAVPVLIDTLKTERIRWQACDVLGELGTRAKPAIPALMEVFKDDSRVVNDVRVYRYAEQALLRIGPDAVPSLTQGLASEEARVRASSVTVLSKMKPVRTEVVPLLAERLKDPDKRVRICAAAGLHSMQAETESAVRALVELLKDEDWRIRNDAAHELGVMGPNAAAALPALRMMGNETNQAVRSAVEYALRNIERLAARQAQLPTE